MICRCARLALSTALAMPLSGTSIERLFPFRKPSKRAVAVAVQRIFHQSQAERPSKKHPTRPIEPSEPEGTPKKHPTRPIEPIEAEVMPKKHPTRPLDLSEATGSDLDKRSRVNSRILALNANQTVRLLQRYLILDYQLGIALTTDDLPEQLVSCGISIPTRRMLLTYTRCPTPT